ncbi:MAG: hypothetical protein CW742_15150, partial [Methanoregula sp.]
MNCTPVQIFPGTGHPALTRKADRTPDRMNLPEEAPRNLRVNDEELPGTGHGPRPTGMMLCERV